MSRLERVTSDPNMCHGKPTIRGLRYPVENLLELLASGMTIEEVVADHPDLERRSACRHRVRRPGVGHAAVCSPRRVRFLVDAQLPPCLAHQLRGAGHDALHSGSLPNGNRSSDVEITSAADAEDRVVITEDRGFRDGHLLRRSPRRLLMVTTGNISNDQLLAASG